MLPITYKEPPAVIINQRKKIILIFQGFTFQERLIQWTEMVA